MSSIESVIDDVLYLVNNPEWERVKNPIASKTTYALKGYGEKVVLERERGNNFDLYLMDGENASVISIPCKGYKKAQDAAKYAIIQRMKNGFRLNDEQ